MKSTRFPVLVLALILALAPSGFAASYGSLTLSNFYIEPGDQKPVDVDASLTVGFGGAFPEGPARLDVEITGGGKLAFGGTAEIRDGQLRAVMERTKYRFEIPLKGLEDALSQSPSPLMYNLWYVLPPELYYSLSGAMYYGGYGDAGDGPKPEDFEALWDLLKRYAAYYGDLSDPAKSLERDRKLYALLKPEFKGVESVELYGATQDLYRYEMAFEGSALKAYYDAVYEADPVLKALEEETARLMEGFGMGIGDGRRDEDDDEDDDEDASGDADGASQEDSDPDSGDGDEDLLSRMIEGSAFEKIAFVLWSDAEELADPATKAQKTTMTLTVKDAVDAYGMPVALNIPITTTWQQISGGKRVGFEAVYAPYEGETTKLFVDARLREPLAGVPTVSSVTATLEASSEDGMFSARLFGERIVDAHGVGDTAVSIKGASNGQDFSVGYAYDGKTATDGETSGSLTLAYDLPASGGGEPAKAVIRFDAQAVSGPYPPMDFEKYADLQPVNPLRAGYKAMEKVSGDLGNATMQGMGVLMQTHGLSNLIGGLMRDMIAQ